MSLWPRAILEFLFCFPPTTSTNSLAGFFYGNRLPCSMALHLVSVCHCAPTEQMWRIRSLYVEWYGSPNDRHLSIYWDMRHQKFVWLSGSNLPQLEFLDTPGGNNDTITGFGIKPKAWMLRRKLYRIRHYAHHYH